MSIEQIRKDILDWSEKFVEVPHKALGGWPPCPYARRARLNNTIGIFQGTDPYYDLKVRARHGLGQYEVVIYAYDPTEWDYNNFHASLESAHSEFLLPKNLLVLEDHPDDAEIVNGICMNQGKYALALVQDRADLDEKAAHMFSKGFYHSWPEEYLNVLFANRKDPR